MDCIEAVVGVSLDVLIVWDVADDGDDADDTVDDDDDDDDDFFSFASCWAFLERFHFMRRFWNQILTCRYLGEDKNTWEIMIWPWFTWIL